MINGKLYIGADNIANGWFTARNIKPDSHRNKLRVAANGQSVFYDLSLYGVDGEETFPLQFGDGRYTVELYRNTSGSRYAVIGRVNLNVKLSSPTAPYLHPNQYVDYTSESPCTLKAAELCKNCTSSAERVAQVRKWIESNIVYDYIKAAKVGKSVLPDIDDCFRRRMGICQDIAALMVAMLRSQGVPASLVIGYADTKYHAWVRVYIDDEVRTYDPYAAIIHKKNVKKYTALRWY